MDSLTQIMLSAPCGEAVLGKKIDNKALLFGVIGGTIPDLDVLVGNLAHDNEIDAMLFHRGFMYSILFSVVGTFVFGMITYGINSLYMLLTLGNKFYVDAVFSKSLEKNDMKNTRNIKEPAIFNNVLELNK